MICFMVDLQPDQLRTLAAIDAAGTFEAAAQRLGVTPSAVSQRVRALESAVGQVLVRRGKPAGLTPPGQVLVRHARHLALQQADVLAELGIGAAERAGDPADPDGAVAPLPEVTLVVSGDALTTWALPALVEASGWARLEVLREDEEHSIGLLRDGTAVAAVTSVAEAVPGCRSTLLGQMRYRPMASPEFAARWFPDGPTAAALARAPVLAFDRKDDLQPPSRPRVERVPARDRARHGLGHAPRPPERPGRACGAPRGLRRRPGDGRAAALAAVAPALDVPRPPGDGRRARGSCRARRSLTSGRHPLPQTPASARTTSAAGPPGAFR
ncbi:MAG: hypothetical protein K0S43_3684 [Cellulosimicrobium sp.]|nr:hypothetical protein [Cellulosimicrobium sp.]